jgi:transglutaminase-like putative cysteine protease
VDLSIGCRIAFHCEASTPLLALVHPHASLVEHLLGPERLELRPDRFHEVLADQAGNRWCRLLAAAGSTSLRYDAIIQRPDTTDPVLPGVLACPVEALPIDTYRYLNASTYCDTPALMDLAWSCFAAIPRGWPLVQAICDWVHNRIRFDYDAIHPHKRASDALAEGAGVCRDYAHLAISLCRCLNIPARYCTGYLGYTGIPPTAAPVDFSAWFEAFLCDRWYVFDARHNIPRCGRVLIGRGRDAADVPFLRSFGAHQLSGFEVITEAIPEPTIEPTSGLYTQTPAAAIPSDLAPSARPFRHEQLDAVDGLQAGRHEGEERPRLVG